MNVSHSVGTLPLAAALLCLLGVAVAAQDAAARPDFLRVVFRHEPADAACFPRCVEHLFRSRVLRLAHDRLVDVSRWRPDGKGADAIVTVASKPGQIQLDILLTPKEGTPSRTRLDFPAADTAGRMAALEKAAVETVKLLTGSAPVGRAAPLPLPPEAALAEMERALGLPDGGPPDALIAKRAVLSKAVELAPAWPLPRIELGRVIAEQGDAEAATKLLFAALQLDADDPATHAELGRAFRRMDRSADAISEYSRALALAPRDPALRNDFAVALLAAGHAEGAVRHFNKAVEIEPLYHQPLVNLGSYYRSIGEEAKAEQEYRRAIERAPRDPGPRIVLAKLLTDAGQHRAAQQELEAAVAADPSHTAARFELALVLATRQKYAAAIEHLEAVLGAAPENREARYNLGLALHYHGKDARAIEVFEDAIRRDPDYAHFYYGLGLTYEARGEKVLAEEALKMALEKAPDFGAAEVALKRLRGERSKPELAWPFAGWCRRVQGAGTAASFVPTALTMVALLAPGMLFRLLRRRKNVRRGGDPGV